VNPILLEFFRANAGLPFRYGERDCLLWLADWGKALAGVDAAAGWRGRCSTALGAARILKREGGMVAIVEKAFAPLGWRRTEAPRCGDLAVVATARGSMGAIMLFAMGQGQAPLTASLIGTPGIKLQREPLVAAWALCPALNLPLSRPIAKEEPTQ
jgi:hypothetical protein